TVDRIGSIVKALKTFARDSQHDALTPHNFQQIAADTLNMCKERLRNHGAKLVYDEATANLLLDCRPTEISQVLLNLLNNSLDAIETLDEKWIKLECVVVNEEVQIIVTDSGPGIPAAVAAKIMQPFFTTKDIGKGTGLGLSISRSIADAHGGKLELEAGASNTKFVLKLPALKEAA
ncbi:MAG: GHKL domain-containing protein, partial [Proteobacteria bacterium]